MATFTEKRFRAPMTISRRQREALIATLRDELSSHGEIDFAYVYGSFARGEPFRDVDIGVFTSRTEDIFYELDLGHELSRKLGVPVDLKVINEAPVALQMAVFRDGQVLLSRDDDRRKDLMERVGRRYREYAHFRNLDLGIDGLRR